MERGRKHVPKVAAHVARAVRFRIEETDNALIAHLRIYTTTDLGQIAGAPLRLAKQEARG